jgi:hypothetical protein
VVDDLRHPSRDSVLERMTRMGTLPAG